MENTKVHYLTTGVGPLCLAVSLHGLAFPVLMYLRQVRRSALCVARWGVEGENPSLA